MPRSLDGVDSNVALVSAIVLYPLVLRATLTTCRPSASPSQFMRSRETISAAHAILVSLAAGLELYRQRNAWWPPSPSFSGDAHLVDSKGDLGDPSKVAAKQRLDIINAPSSVGDAIVAWECGYLLQDFIVLIVKARRSMSSQGRIRRVPPVMARTVNWRIMAWHHVSAATALALFHVRARRGEAKGIMVVLMMFLMNLSTPIGTLHWYLAKFEPQRRVAVLLAHITYLGMYALCRVGLMFWIVRVYGLWTDRSLTSAFRSLQQPCKVGTSAIAVANTAWLILGIKKFIRTYLY